MVYHFSLHIIVTVGPVVTRLQETSINVIDNEKCAEMYKNQRAAVIDERVLCAGEPGKDACQVCNVFLIFFFLISSHDLSFIFLFFI